MIAYSEMDALGILWMLRLDRPLPENPEPDTAAAFLRASHEIASELAEAMGLETTTPVLKRFDRGRHCYIGQIDYKIATYGWITFDQESIGELGLTIRLQQDEAYIWDCATLPPYRRQHLYPALLAHMLHELQRTGLQRIWIGTDADNLPSQSGVARVGCEPILEIIRALDGGFLSRGHPGASFQNLLDAHYALFGNRDRSRIVMLENYE